MSIKVYISSATKEMKDYRIAAISAIEKVGMTPVYLNDGFPPSHDPNLSLLDLNQRYVKGCDAFVGLYGYGPTWHPEDNNPKLISEWEYEWARDEKLPCFCFMPGTNPPQGLKSEGADPDMEYFKWTLARKHPVIWLQSPDQVIKTLEESLNALQDSIFISYSSIDREFALWLKDEFRKDNYSLWRDGDRIEAGSEWRTQLEKGLETCRLMIVLLSPDSIKSDYVADEIEAFINEGKSIFPVKIRPCQIPEYLSKWQVVDATEDRDRAFLRLKRAIENVLHRK